MRRRIVLSAPAAAVMLAGALAIPAPAAAPEPTLRFSAIPDARSFGGNDARPPGESPGDTNVFSMRLQRSGEVAGRLEGISTSVDPRFAGAAFTVSVLLPAGSLQLQGFGLNAPAPATPDVKRRDTVLAVVGGTGDYSGASGEAVLHATDGMRQTLTITLE